MKKIILTITYILILLVLNGCWILSVYPFYCKDNIVKLPEIYGEWKILKDSFGDMKEKNSNAWNFGNDYIKTFDNENIQATIAVVYFSIDQKYFIDCISDEHDGLNKYWKVMIFPAHTILKVELKGDSLRLIPLDFDKTIEIMENNRTELEYLKPLKKEDIGLFINSSESWIEFLSQNMHDPALFNIKNELLFKRSHN